VTVAAVDLGASGGRVMAGRVMAGRAGAAGVELHEVYRFPNEPVAAGGTLYWDILRLYAEVRHGLELAARRFALAGLGIDSWGVDFGLLDASGALLGNPVHYRDARTTGVPARVHAAVPAAELYAVTGIQQLPFNTIYQLAATPVVPHAATMLLIPDLLGYWTAWPWPTGARSPRRSRCPGGTPTSCISSAAAPATRCCASSPPTPPACR